MLPCLRAFGNSLLGFDPALVLVCALWCTLLSHCALRLDARGLGMAAGCFQIPPVGKGKQRTPGACPVWGTSFFASACGEQRAKFALNSSDYLPGFCIGACFHLVDGFGSLEL